MLAMCGPWCRRRVQKGIRNGDYVDPIVEKEKLDGKKQIRPRGGRLKRRLSRYG